MSDPDTTKINTVTVGGVEVFDRCGGRDGGYWRCPHCRHPMQNTSGAEIATQRCAACGCPLGAATPTTRAVHHPRHSQRHSQRHRQHPVGRTSHGRAEMCRTSCDRDDHRYSLRETDERAYAGATVLRLTLHPPPESGLPDREVGVAHVRRWFVPTVPEAVKALVERHPALRGWGLLAPSWLAVHEPGAGHGLRLLAELAKYAGRVTDHVTDHAGKGCILFSSSLIVPGFASAQALRAWRSSRLRAISGIVVGDRCAGWLPGAEID